MGLMNNGIRQTRNQTVSNNAKRVKLNPVNYLDDDNCEISDISVCNHKMESLQKLEDGKYFTEEFVKEKNETPNCYYASVCDKCKGHVRDRVPA